MAQTKSPVVLDETAKETNEILKELSSAIRTSSDLDLSIQNGALNQTYDESSDDGDAETTNPIVLNDTAKETNNKLQAIADAINNGGSGGGFGILPEPFEIEFNENVTPVYMHCFKWGKLAVCIFHIRPKTNTSIRVGSVNTIGKLPEGCEPIISYTSATSGVFALSTAIATNGDALKGGAFSIRENGNITVYAYADGKDYLDETTPIRGNLVWFTE